MKNILLVIVLLISLNACYYDEITAIETNMKSPRTWVYAQFNIPNSSDEIESYYYYALISETLYSKILNNELERGFIHLGKVRYWDNNDRIDEYRDRESFGDLILRIEHIVKMEKIVKEPIVGLGIEQFDDDTVIEQESEIQNSD